MKAAAEPLSSCLRYIPFDFRRLNDSSRLFQKRQQFKMQAAGAARWLGASQRQGSRRQVALLWTDPLRSIFLSLALPFSIFPGNREARESRLSVSS
ncbi:hypothetical protein MTO96_025756 [Rhipicephalus appendiculatus]